MKKLLFLLFFIPLVSFGQNLFFIGDNSYPSTDFFRLEKGENSVLVSELYINFVKDNEKKYIVVSVKFYSQTSITDKLFIYLTNGTVLTSNSAFSSDYVDGNLISMYQLTDNDISEIINSNIHSIRYKIDLSYGDENRTATYNGNEMPKKLKNIFPNN